MEQVGQDVGCLAFLGAYVPLNHKTAADMAPRDPHKKIHGAIVVDAEKGTSSLPRSPAISQMLYGEWDAAIAAAAMEQLVPEPLRPATERLTLTGSGFHATRKACIECLRDRVISIDYQRQMRRDADFDLIMSIDTDHSGLDAGSQLIGSRESAFQSFRSDVHQHAVRPFSVPAEAWP